MLLFKCIISIMWGFCSTVLILPWFWKSIILRKTLVGNENERGWEKSELSECISAQLIFGLITSMASFLYYTFFIPKTFFHFILPIIFTMFFQTININMGYNDKKTKKSLIMLGICVIYLILSIVTY